MKVGDYVRTKYGITQFKEYETTNGSKFLCMPVKDGSQGIFADVEDVIKSSPNIIDLIEVGDYVNGYKVTMLEDKYYDNVTDSVKKIKDKEKIKIILGNEEQFYGVYAKDIKSIVTKEQFKSMEYKIGE